MHPKSVANLLNMSKSTHQRCGRRCSIILSFRHVFWSISYQLRQMLVFVDRYQVSGLHTRPWTHGCAIDALECLPSNDVTKLPRPSSHPLRTLSLISSLP